MISIQQDDFDPGSEALALEDSRAQAGAVVTFTGRVRDLADNPLQSMFLEHYPGMTEKALERILEQARGRWALLGVRVIHRVGQLGPGDRIVFVGVSSAHRRDAFAACEFIMDYLKRDAPFWKKELSASGEHWVEQKASDRQAAERWQAPARDRDE